MMRAKRRLTGQPAVAVEKQHFDVDAGLKFGSATL
jgi:hypothetical protein